MLESDSIQYADDTNIYKSSSKANTIPTMRTLENDISELLKWSKYSVLGVTFDQHLTLNEQINTITKSNYNILRILKAFKRFTPWNVQKSLAESLILSRINYCILCILKYQNIFKAD